MTNLRDIYVCLVLYLAILNMFVYNFGPSIFRNILFSSNSETTSSHVIDIDQDEGNTVVLSDMARIKSEEAYGRLKAVGSLPDAMIIGSKKSGAARDSNEGQNARQRRRGRGRGRMKDGESVGRLPDAIIIGSKKSGTGTFKKFLARHPDICMAEDEITYFNSFRLSKGLSWYSRQFPDCLPHQIQMEKTPGYISCPTAAKDIQAMNSTIKLLLILRDPTKRLISDYVEGCTNGPKSLCTGTFQQMVMAPNRPSGVKEGFKPVTESLYAKQLKRYLKHFPLSQIHIIDGEAFVKNPVPELKKAEKFLNIRPYLTDSLFAYNEAKGFFCHIYENNVTDCLPPRKGRKHPYVSPMDLMILRDYYRPFNQQLFKLIGKRFAWD